MTAKTKLSRGVGPLFAILSVTVMVLTGGCSSEAPEPSENVDRSDHKYLKCWVHVSNKSGDPKFKNPFDQIRGPISLPNLRALEGTRHADWSGRIDALGAGPAAKVTVWSDEEFKGKSHELKPGEKLEDFKAAGLSGVGSLKIEYVSGG